MADRSGQTTHEFTTNRIFKIFFWIWVFGAVSGAVLTYLGLETTTYQNIADQIKVTVTTHWWISPFLLATFIGVIWLRSLGKKGKTHGQRY